MPPKTGLKKPVFATISKLNKIRVPAKTGVDRTTSMLVPNIAQQYMGNCINLRPGLLNFKIVAIKLIPPKMELPPSKRTLKIHTICPD